MMFVAVARRAIFGLVATASIAVTLLSLQPVAVAAAGILPTPHGKCPEEYAAVPPLPAGKGACANGVTRDYAPDDVKLLLGNIGNLMLGISGTVALFVFVLGGFFWLISAGNSGLVSKGKSMMISAMIGLVIIFFSFTLITYGVKILGGAGTDQYIPKAAGPSAGGGDVQYSVAKNTSNVSSSQLCTSKFNGVCAAKGKCGSGYPIVGACSGASDCCVQTKFGDQKSVCGKLGGTCQKNTDSCGGAYVKNLCLTGGDSLDASVQCCLGE